MKFESILPNLVQYNYDPRSLAVAHFNNDTWLDIVVVNRAIPSISVYLASDDGTFTKPNIYPTGPHSDPYMVVAGHLNYDQFLDIVIANFDTNNIEIFQGNGQGSFVSQLILSTNSSHPIYIHLVDLNNDTLIDIVTANYGTNSICIFYGDRDGHFSHSIVYGLDYDSLPYSIISGDFNNDNHLDLVITNYGTNNIQILLANGNTSFSHHKIFSTGIQSHPHAIVLGYFNNDILLDIAVANSGTNSVGVFLGMGNGTFTSQTSYFLGDASPQSIGIHDFNKDNRVDIVVTGKGSGNIAVLLGHGNGTFSAATTISTGSTFFRFTCHQ